MKTLEFADLEKNLAVLKVSSGMLLNKDGVGVNNQAVEEVAERVVEVDEKYHVLIVHGGAVGAGRAYVQEFGEDHTQVDEQVLASYGSPIISTAIQKALKEKRIMSGQIQANHNQMKAGSILMQAILHGVILHRNTYHINENDQENIYELRLLKEEEEEKTVRKKPLGIDNDPLGAQLTIALIEELKAEGLDEELAIHLAMFTEIGGVVMKKELQAEISASNRQQVYQECDGTRPGGSGGMRVKVEACFDAFDAGAKTVHIASPDQSWLDVIEDRGELGKVTKVVQ